MAQQSHVITAVTAAAIGIAGTLAASGIPSVLASSLVKKINVEAEYPNTNPAVAEIWNRVDTALCPQAETAAELDEGECSIEPGTVVSLTRRDNTTRVVASFKFAGTWTIGEPQ